MKHKNWLPVLGKSILVVLVIAVFSVSLTRVKADNNYFALVPGTPFTQDWTNIAMITAPDDWSGVPSINGYRGDDATAGTGVDPQTVLADYSGVIDVLDDQINPDTQTTGGVAEFDAIANPTIALQGSGTADFPHIDIRLDTTNCTDPANRINLTYNVRDIDGSADNAVQPVALQYRVGNTGSYTNIPGGFIADASTGPSQATLVTPIALTLPTATQGQSQVHLRIMTSNAVGSDEWVGIDDIRIVCGVPTAASAGVSGQVKTASGRGIGNVIVTLTGGGLTEPLTAITNPFGYYRFEDLQVGSNYVLSVSSKRYTFDPSSRVVNVQDNVEDADFVSVEP